MLRKTISLLVLLVLATSTLTIAEAGKPGGGGPSYPNSIASLGDSITKAMNVNGNNWFDNPEHSWSTGYESGDGVESHYERLLSLNRKIRSNFHNDAVSGAKMVDLAGQAQTAVGQNPQYVTILMGANDLCTSSPATMTSVATFRAQFRAAADTLATGVPGAKVYVTSIPDVYQLWALYDGNWAAEWVWDSFNVCQSLLSNSRSEADRQVVRQRNIDFNTVLAEEVANYGFHWDGNAVFNTAFTTSDVSSVDYFHPSMNGQAKLASATWAAGPYA